MQRRPSIQGGSYVVLLRARRGKKKCHPLVENNLLAHLQGHVRWDQKQFSEIGRARVAKPGRDTISVGHL